jgi:hypothetical protein
VGGSPILTLPTSSGTILTTTGGVNPGTAGNLLTSDGTNWTSAAPSAVGVGQTWQLPTRVAGTTYTNSTGKPIQVLVSLGQGLSGSGSATVVVGGVTISSTSFGTSAGGSTLPYTISFIVPNAATYSVSVSGNTGIGTWAELR